MLYQHILKKIFVLIHFLDAARMGAILPISNLFELDAVYKSSKDILSNFARLVLKSEGDVIKHLNSLGCQVHFQQSFLDEFDFSVRDLQNDLKDGVRLARLYELLADVSHLSSDLRVPAISRLQKIHNVKLVLQNLFQRGEAVPDPKSIVDGDQSVVSIVLWKMLYAFELRTMVDNNKVLKECQRLKVDLAWYRISEEGVSSPQNEEVEDTSIENLLLLWCQSIVEPYGIFVENLTSSLFDGRVIALIISFYHPTLLPSSLIKDFPVADWITSTLSKEERDLCNTNKKKNWHYVSLACKAMGGIPTALNDLISKNSADESTVIIFLGYLFSRLVDSAEILRAALKIQNFFLKHLGKNNRSHIKVRHLAKHLIKTGSAQYSKISPNVLARPVSQADQRKSILHQPGFKKTHSSYEDNIFIKVSGQVKPYDPLSENIDISSSIDVQEIFADEFLQKVIEEDDMNSLLGLDENASDDEADAENKIHEEARLKAEEEEARLKAEEEEARLRAEEEEARLRAEEEDVAESVALSAMAMIGEQAFEIEVSKIIEDVKNANNEFGAEIISSIILDAFQELSSREDSVSLIQSVVRMHLHHKAYRCGRLAVIILQDMWRRKVVLRNHIHQQNTSATMIAKTFRGFFTRRMFFLQKAAAVCLQTNFRRHFAVSNYLLQKNAIILLQSFSRIILAKKQRNKLFYARNTIVRSLWNSVYRQRTFSALHNFIATERESQRLERVRKQQEEEVLAKMDIAAREQYRVDLLLAKLLQMRQQRAANTIVTAVISFKVFMQESSSAKKIQRFFHATRPLQRIRRMLKSFNTIVARFRGRKVRKQSKKKIQAILIRLEKANEEARLNPGSNLTLGQKTAAALNTLQTAKMISALIKACQALQTSTLYSQDSCEKFVMTDSARIVLALIQTCNRSQPHQELLRLCLLVLLNVSRYPHLAEHIGEDIDDSGANAADVLMDLMQMFRDKQCVFKLATHLLGTLVGCSEHAKSVCLVPGNKRRLDGIAQILERKQRIESKCKSHQFGGSGANLLNLLASPDHKTRRQSGSFRDSLKEREDGYEHLNALMCMKILLALME
jgi:abnormal spindle-like microcephaly-associated protein